MCVAVVGVTVLALRLVVFVVQLEHHAELVVRCRKHGGRGGIGFVVSQVLLAGDDVLYR